MMQHRVKHLEPVYIGYTNEWKNAVVTEDGSKFYPNDLVYHKSIDTMLQKLDEEDKELVILWNTVFPIQADSIKKGIFYLNEKECDEYCAQALNFLETADSEECRYMTAETRTHVQESQFYDWAQLEVYFNDIPKELEGSDDDKKIRENWKRRGVSTGEGVNGKEVHRTIMMLKLAAMHFSKGLDLMSNLTKYQRFKKGRKVIMRIMSDRRVEDYNDWDVCCEDMLDAIYSMLHEEGRLEAMFFNIQVWRAFNQQNKSHSASVKEFKIFLKDLDIDHSRIILVPDIHFIKQWIELPLKVDYTCATILRPDGKECYRTIQAQLHLFERLACDIDWEVASKKYPQKAQEMGCKIIGLMENTQKMHFLPPELIERLIEKMESDNFFAESRKKAMKTPLYICRQKKYNDYMPISDFKKMFKLHYRKATAKDEFLKLDKIEMWKVRFIFLIRWIDIFLAGNKKLFNNLMAAITMQVGVVNLKNDAVMKRYCMAYNLDRFIDYDKIKVFEEMANNSGIRKLDAPSQNVPEEVPKKPIKNKKSNLKRRLDKAEDKKSTEDIARKEDQVEIAPKKKCEEVLENEESKNTVNDQSPKETLEKESKVAEVEPEVSEVEKCPGCDEKEKKHNDEIDALKRQLVEKENRSKSDALRIQQLKSELEKSQKMMAQQEENAKEVQKTLREQANKIKQDYKAENQKLKQSLENKENRIKQLDMELKECRENAKNERKKMNSEADSESKIATTTMKKMKTELEMAKLTETTNFKKINKLEKENGQLKTQMEILEEQRYTGSEKEERIQELTRKCQDLKLENMGLSADVEELTVTNQEFEKLALKNHELMAEIDRLKILSSEIGIKNSQPSICSKCSSINGASFGEIHSENCRDCPICIEDIENNDQNARKCESCRAEYHGNCLSEWLNINPTCPNCRVHWPNPQEFPAL